MIEVINDKLKSLQKLDKNGEFGIGVQGFIDMVKVIKNKYSKQDDEKLCNAFSRLANYLTWKIFHSALIELVQFDDRQEDVYDKIHSIIYEISVKASNWKRERYPLDGKKTMIDFIKQKLEDISTLDADNKISANRKNSDKKNSSITELIEKFNNDIAVNNDNNTLFNAISGLIDCLVADYI